MHELLSSPHKKAEEEMGFSEALNSLITSPVSDFMSEAIPFVPTTCKLRPFFAKARPASPLKRGENVNHLSYRFTELTCIRENSFCYKIQ